MSTETSSITVVPTQVALEGGGFQIGAPFRSPTSPTSIDPADRRDGAGDYGPARRSGAGASAPRLRNRHVPHRRWDGARRFTRSRGALGPGDVQWMTAGAGVIHSEMRPRRCCATAAGCTGSRSGSICPRRSSSHRHAIRNLRVRVLPVVAGPGTWVRVIAGELAGRRSPIETTVPTTMLHVKLEAGARLQIPIAPARMRSCTRWKARGRSRIRRSATIASR